MPSQSSDLYLFGGSKPWNPLDWTSSDDRVRGGSSYSELSCSPVSPIAEFRGNLDIKTLGGAGFASQRTTGEDLSWDLSFYDGLELGIAASDDKQYTLVVKDELLPKSPNGRDQSTVSWEYDFKVSAEGPVFFKFDQLKPTYRGREKEDAEPLDLKNIKRISLMMRSFFGTQEGDFSLSIRSISAKLSPDSKSFLPEPYHDDPNGAAQNEKSTPWDSWSSPRPRGWLAWFSSFCPS